MQKIEVVYVRQCIWVNWGFPQIFHFMPKEFHSLGCSIHNLILAFLARLSSHHLFLYIGYMSVNQGLSFPPSIGFLTLLPPWWLFAWRHCLYIFVVPSVSAEMSPPPPRKLFLMVFFLLFQMEITDLVSGPHHIAILLALSSAYDWHTIFTAITCSSKQ